MQIPLRPEVTVLVGENNAGKSSVIDALRLLTDPREPTSCRPRPRWVAPSCSWTWPTSARSTVAQPQAPPGSVNTRPWCSDPLPQPPADCSSAGGDDLVADLPHRRPLRDGSKGAAGLLEVAQLPARARGRRRTGRCRGAAERGRTPAPGRPVRRRGRRAGTGVAVLGRRRRQTARRG
ncbi:hypothetical protein ABZ299_25455 [Streptomyces sp. NPDC006184]|uniref:hypothetical protein n=1 Tax=Streptomyces sp. NPDC006184 TaxID=3155455 RepID=UPI0033A70E8D